MNRHAQKRLTEKTLIELACLLTAAGYRNSHGGVPITVPRETAEHIHALAYDVNHDIARKAKLDPSPQWQTGPVRVNGEVVA